MSDFGYVRPESLEETFALLARSGKQKLLAGGTDLMNEIKDGLCKAKLIVDLKGLPEMNGIRIDDEWVKIGALTSIRTVEASPYMGEKLSILAYAASTVGSVQIRNRGTVGGNLCQASPSADLAAVLLTMESELTVASRSGKKKIPLSQFFTGPKSNSLSKGEVLCEIAIPRSAERFRGIYLKHGTRNAMDIGIANIAILLELSDDLKECREVRIGMGAVAPTPMRAAKAEKFLAGRPVDASNIEQTAMLAAEESKPITDFRASEEYRRELVKSLVVKGIHSLLG